MDTDSNELEELFHAAADHLAQLVSSNPASVPDPVKLKLYGLYKQATVGPCNTSKPAFWDRPGCSKWNAWNQLGSTLQPAAMEQYIETLAQQDPKWLDTAAGAAAGSSKPSSSSKKSGVGGPVFSTLNHGSDEQLEAAGGSSSSSRLHELAGQADLSGLQARLNSGTAVDAWDDQGCTALHFAADRGQPDAAVLLLSAGADINAQDHDGQTPLHYAAMCEQLEVCKLLLARGADASIADAEGQTPQHLAPPTWTCWQ